MSLPAIASEKKSVNFRERKFFGMSDKIKAVAKVMAENDNININLGHNRPSTDGKSINLPYVNPSLTVSEVDCHIGYINHEAAHVLHSDFSKVKKDLSILNLQFKEVDINLLHYIYNSVEDVRVETERFKTNPGSPMYLNTMNRAILDEAYKTVDKKSKSNNIPEKAVSSAILYNIYCYFGGNTDHPYWDIAKLNPHHEPLVKRLSTVYKYVIDNSSDIQTTLTGTREVVKRIAEFIEEVKNPPKDQTPPPTQPQPEDTPPSPSDSPKLGESQNGTSPPDPSQQPQNTPPKDGQSDSTSTSQTNGQPTPSDQTNTDPLKEDQQNSKDSGTNGEDVGSSPNLKDNITDTQSNTLKELTKQLFIDKDIVVNTTTGEYQSRAEQLKESIIQSNSLSVKPLDKLNIDKGTTKELANKRNVLPETISKGKEASTGIRAAFVKSLRSFKNKTTKRNQREGILDTRAISRYKLGKKVDIFKTTKKYRRLNTSLHITLDASYSMGQGDKVVSKAETARRVIIAMNYALRGLNIKFSFSLFNSSYVLVKNISTPFNLDLLKSLTGSGGTDLAKAIISSGYYLSGTTQPRKILICVTDGEVEPNVIPTDKLVCGSGIEVYYVIIGTKSPSNIPKSRYIVLNSKDFSKKFLDSLQSLLLTGKFNNG